MKSIRQKTNWWVDAALFVGFIGAFFLNLSGVVLHQWLGVVAGVLAARIPSRRDFLKLAGLTGVAALVSARKARGA